MAFFCNIYGKNHIVASAKKGDFFMKREKKVLGAFGFRRSSKTGFNSVSGV
jgi:hypothetical protein